MNSCRMWILFVDVYKRQELMVNVVPVRTKDLEWSLNFNFSKNKNKVVALAEDKGISRIRQIERLSLIHI